MEQIVFAYYADNAQKLRRIVDKILFKFGGISNKDMDDFYSLANEVFVDVIKKYDDSQTFDGFLYSCLLNRIKTEVTRRNREKRKIDRFSVSLDMPIDYDGADTIGDTIPSDIDIERDFFERNGEYSRRMMLYLNKLSGIQKEVLLLIKDGYCPNEIRQRLHIDEKEYANCNAAIHSYRNVSALL